MSGQQGDETDANKAMSRARRDVLCGVLLLAVLLLFAAKGWHLSSCDPQCLPAQRPGRRSRHRRPAAAGDAAAQSRADPVRLAPLPRSRRRHLAAWRGAGARHRARPHRRTDRLPQPPRAGRGRHRRDRAGDPPRQGGGAARRRPRSFQERQRGARASRRRQRAARRERHRAPRAALLGGGRAARRRRVRRASCPSIRATPTRSSRSPNISSARSPSRCWRAASPRISAPRSASRDPTAIASRSRRCCAAPISRCTPPRPPGRSRHAWFDASMERELVSRNDGRGGPARRHPAPASSSPITSSRSIWRPAR